MWKLFKVKNKHTWTPADLKFTALKSRSQVLHNIAVLRNLSKKRLRHGIFLWILRKFSERTFCKKPLDDCCLRFLPSFCFFLLTLNKFFTWFQYPLFVFNSKVFSKLMMKSFIISWNTVCFGSNTKHSFLDFSVYWFLTLKK